MKSAAEALLLLWAGDGLFDLFTVPDWQAVAGVAAGAAVLSLLFSLVSYQAGSRGTASIVSEVTYQPKEPL